MPISFRKANPAGRQKLPGKNCSATPAGLVFIIPILVPELLDTARVRLPDTHPWWGRRGGCLCAFLLHDAFLADHLSSI
jgi:hypothetical protein